MGRRVRYVFAAASPYQPVVHVNRIDSEVRIPQPIAHLPAPMMATSTYSVVMAFRNRLSNGIHKMEEREAGMDAWNANSIARDRSGYVLLVSGRSAGGSTMNSVCLGSIVPDRSFRVHLLGENVVCCPVRATHIASDELAEFLGSPTRSIIITRPFVWTASESSASE